MSDEEKKTFKKDLLQKNIAQIESQTEQYRFTLSVAENTLDFLRAQLAEVLK